MGNGMAKETVASGDQKAFVRIFNGICQWNSPWERWNDMMMMFAIELAGLDVKHREERSKSYKAISGKYKPKELEGFQALACELVSNLEKNPFQDFLGKMYMELNFGNSHAGQFFTPYHLCQAMASVQLQTDETRKKIDDNGFISINDPACGAGATLIAAAEALYRMGINYQQTALFIGQDLDQTVALMCYIQLSLIGCAGYVHIGNTLTEPLTGDALIPTGTGNTWYTPMYFHPVWRIRSFNRWKDQRVEEVRSQKSTFVMLQPEEEDKEREHNKPGQISFL